MHTPCLPFGAPGAVAERGNIIANNVFERVRSLEPLSLGFPSVQAVYLDDQHSGRRCVCAHTHRAHREQSTPVLIGHPQVVDPGPGGLLVEWLGVSFVESSVPILCSSVLDAVFDVALCWGGGCLVVVVVMVVVVGGGGKWSRHCCREQYVQGLSTGHPGWWGPGRRRQRQRV
jgi:hypothetical protein